MKKSIKTDDLLRFLGNRIIDVKGKKPDNLYIDRINDISFSNESSLEWINPLRANKQLIAENTKSKIIICDNSIIYTKKLARQKKVLVIVHNPRLVITLIAKNFFESKLKIEKHKTAILHERAQIGKNVFIGAYSTIGECIIGKNSIIYNNVVINECVQIGENVIIKPGSVIGYDGFGYEKDESGNYNKFPQLGGLIIENNVEIGANTCIDRGSLSNTYIGFNSKINNLCHIAHNVVIGSNVIITAHANISGSTTIGDNVWIGPNSTLRGHQNIGKNVIIGAGAVVTKDIPEGEIWVGNPAKKMR